MTPRQSSHVAVITRRVTGRRSRRGEGHIGVWPREVVQSLEEQSPVAVMVLKPGDNPFEVMFRHGWVPCGDTVLDRDGMVVDVEPR